MTVQFYENNAEQFAQDTLNVDMSALYERFLGRLAPSSRILDAGCGAGRDTAAFFYAWVIKSKLLMPALSW